MGGGCQGGGALIYLSGERDGLGKRGEREHDDGSRGTGGVMMQGRQEEEEAGRGGKHQGKNGVMKGTGVRGKMIRATEWPAGSGQTVRGLKMDWCKC